MEIHNDTKPHWTICLGCHGQGKVLREKRSNTNGVPNINACTRCKGSGLLTSKSAVLADSTKYPHVAIIGGGIGGAALAASCLHRGIPFTLYERDESFTARSQGYGLTLQQASKAIEGLGIFSLEGGVTSTRHVVHTPDGTIIGEWGLRKWLNPFVKKTTKRKNVHIARQALRFALLEQLDTASSIKWGHTLTNLSQNTQGGLELTFQVGKNEETVQADLVVGADGIRSKVRSLLLEKETPLHYLGCIVLLGICPLKSLGTLTSPLLDSATVFQTVNGHERMYVMPYDADTIMWQVSFPLLETEARNLSAKGAQAMKDEVCKRLAWHAPIPEILAATPVSQITGYPVYDRALFDPTSLKEKSSVTLLGDAAHPMSPFKGQGANQALLDALTLARKISVACEDPQWREIGIRKSVLNSFEEEMAARSASKVIDSAKAAHLLHTDAVLHEGDSPRGR